MKGERIQRLEKINSDPRINDLLLRIPVESMAVLVNILSGGVEMYSMGRYIEEFVPKHQIEGYKFLRMILYATDLDAVIDTVLSEIEAGLETGEMPRYAFSPRSEPAQQLPLQPNSPT